MLITLARVEASSDSYRIGIAALARSLDIARNTCRLQLDTLMEAGLLMMKLRLDQGKAPLGYEIRLVVDLNDRTSALAEGFQAQRACPHTHRSVTARS